MKGFDYRIYGDSKSKGWQYIRTSRNKETAISEGRKLNPKDYYRYMIIERDEKNDIEQVISKENLGISCSVRYIDDLKTDIKIKATTFSLGRDKDKWDER